MNFQRMEIVKLLNTSLLSIFLPVFYNYFSLMLSSYPLAFPLACTMTLNVQENTK